MSVRIPRVLVVDDDETMREVLDLRLREWKYDVRLATDSAEAANVAQSFDPDIVVADVVMPEVSGLELLRSLTAGDPRRPVILITAHATWDIAVEAMKAGAFDFLSKPLEYPKLQAILKAAEEELELRRAARALQAELEKGSGMGPFIGTGPAMREVYSLIQTVSASDAAVLITGESGTGKELAAATIHAMSRRASGPFIAVNSAAIPETLMESEIFGHERGAFTGATDVRVGCFEMANRGTLFLDEIGEMPLALQPKLLRVLEDRKVRRLAGAHEFTVDVRVIAATNLDARLALQEGKLRQDLYYRLNVFTVALPTLRERLEDLPLLIAHFVRDFNRKHKADVEGVRESALVLMRDYPWPGNVRELRNVLERGVILASRSWIEPHHLPPYVVKLRAGKRATGGQG